MSDAARTMDGVFAVHKPADITSAQVLRDLQRQFNRSDFFKPWLAAERQRLQEEPSWKNRRRGKKSKWIDVKLGHGGTLDPIATGVLITAVGKGTKQLNNFLACTKTYEAVVLFGIATDSYDRVGKVVSRAPYEHVTREKVEEALKKFRGKIMQRPSIFSALKVNGKKLYEYAREGKEPPAEILERPVEVSNLEIVEWYDGGSHEYVWPTEEAEGPEKDIAKKMLAKGSTPEAESTSNSTNDPVASEMADQKEGTSQKRKTSPPPDTADNEPKEDTMEGETSLPAKRQKLDPEGQGEQTTTTEDKELPPTTSAAEAEPSPNPPAVKLTMTVSSGFYVRSLSHDLGLAVGSNAIMSELVRTRQGDFELSPDKTLEYSDMEAGESVWAPKLQRFLDEWKNKETEQGEQPEDKPVAADAKQETED
ncbi:tRNA pseudouridine(55) synthase [Trichophyton interdigitale MR816]|uniref:tRNA pseudouridine(55) synthase n=1 Tax=Trichophyton interdigitale (strain MR816) TaxID=1215338 RepID=A0A059JDR3_TRIIM|nr:tRNA pseudouridine(55) synthase [Trichophyton interdigitale H6]KDB25793.1 tRNA pseudouridine(55) synthase [Trichophyton interdigitale MR816]